VKELVGVVLLGEWLSLCLHLMHKIHKRNSIGCVYLCPARFYGLFTCDWHRLDVDKGGVGCFAIQVSCIILLKLRELFMGN